MILKAIRDKASEIRRMRGALASTLFVPGGIALIFAALIPGADKM
jgi:hypothetical protein